MNLPNKSIAQLRHPNHDRIPVNLQWYSAAIHHFAEFWKNDEKVAQFLQSDDNRDFCITTCLAYLHTLADMLFLCQTQIISSLSLAIAYPNTTQNFSLNNRQQVIENHVLGAFRRHAAHYSTFTASNTFKTHSNSDNEEVDCQDDVPLFHHAVSPTSQCMDQSCSRY